MKVTISWLLEHTQLNTWKTDLWVGNIASLVTQLRFKAKFRLNSQSESDYANTKGWLVSIATGGAVFGCLGVWCPPVCLYWNLWLT